MPQVNVLDPFVRKSIHLNEPKTKEEHWYCNRLVNEALIECVGVQLRKNCLQRLLTIVPPIYIILKMLKKLFIIKTL